MAVRLTGTGGPEALVGRTNELAVLRTALSTAVNFQPSIVLLIGEAGIGKTRLANEVASAGRAAGMRVLYGEADPSIREPMELWRGVYRSLGIESTGDPTLPPAERRWEHLEALVAALKGAGATVVILDDLHWADDMAIWVLEHLPRAIGEVPVAFVATSRDNEPDMPRLDSLKRLSRVAHLGGLDRDEVQQLVDAQAGTPADAGELLARTGGNPLFLRELLHAPHEGVIGEILDRALTRFDTRTRELLATAALAGAGTPLAIIAAAVSTTTAEAEQRLAPAVRDGVLDEAARTGVRFHHALLAEAATRLVDTGVLHARLAEAWDGAAGLDGRSAAVGHRLHGGGDRSSVAEAVTEAADVATELVAAGQQAQAAGLLREAVAVSTECLDRPDLRVRVLLDLAQVLAELGAFDPAHQYYRAAAELARNDSDPLLRARAEIGASLHVNPFTPDRNRLRQLRGALDALPADELHLRAALLGRLAVVTGADPDATDRARAWADEAVEVAQRAGAPLLVVRALLDRHISPVGREELADRDAVADTVIALAHRAGRGDLAIQGHQWRYCHNLNLGNLTAASRALDRAELLGELLPSPEWRYSAMVRRTTLLALAGSREAAVETMVQAARVGVGNVDPFALGGFEMGHRVMLLELYGGTDPAAEELQCSLLKEMGDMPVPFLHIQFAFSAQLLGDDSRVRAVLPRYGPQPDQLLRSVGGDALLRMLGDMVARTSADSFAAPVYDALVPFSGLLNVGNGSSAGLPVDDVLSRLAALKGDVPAAVRHAREAVALARSLPSPPMLVHCLDHLADALDMAGHHEAEDTRAEAATGAAAAGVDRARRSALLVAAGAGRTATMRRAGKSWVLATPIGAGEVPDSAGIRQLARLLSTPGVEVAAVELTGRADGPVAADLGPTLDAEAKRAYRRRLLELRADVDHAEVANDPARADRAQLEIEALLRELERAVGLGGRDRPTGSGSERARINVVRSIKRAIMAISQRAPDLGAHLEVSVRTGRYCSYAPEPTAALSWTVTP